jgi:sterol desaturase/sphingolipid hydroxylase (fatty acid hydroxylase superfamily)
VFPLLLSCKKNIVFAMSAIYPTPLQALYHFAKAMVRGPGLCAIAVHALYPVYLSITRKLKWPNTWVYLAMTAGVHSSLYLAMNGFFGLCDRNGWFQKYKLPRKKSQLPSRALIVATLKQAAIGQMVSPLIALAVHRWVSLPSQEAPLPSLLRCWFHFAMAHLTNEVLFYAAHRLFHEVPYFYQNIHKQHHQYVGTISIAAEYAALPEEILAASIPTMGYMLYARAPYPLFGVWLFYRLFETYESHSGYCFRGAWPSRWLGLLNAERAEFHDWHHTANTGNFGTHVFMDYLFGTMTPYLLSKQKSSSTHGSPNDTEDTVTVTVESQ